MLHLFVTSDLSLFTHSGAICCCFFPMSPFQPEFFYHLFIYLFHIYVLMELQHLCVKPNHQTSSPRGSFGASRESELGNHHVGSQVFHRHARPRPCVEMDESDTHRWLVAWLVVFFLAVMFSRSTPWKINMEPTNHHLERKMIFQAYMIMFHVNLQGCILVYIHWGPWKEWWTLG